MSTDLISLAPGNLRKCVEGLTKHPDQQEVRQPQLQVSGKYPPPQSIHDPGLQTVRAVPPSGQMATFLAAKALLFFVLISDTLVTAIRSGSERLWD